MRKARRAIYVCLLLLSIGIFLTFQPWQTKPAASNALASKIIKPLKPSRLLVKSTTSVSSSFLTNQAQAQTPECTFEDIQNWCQVARDPQHTGFTPEVLGTNIQVAWTHPFQPDKVYPQVQAIIYHNQVYVGTEGANGQVASVYAFNVTTGTQVWKHEIGAPILSSVAAANNRIFVSSMDGAVYALDAATGQQVWKNQLSAYTGFTTSPVVSNNQIMLGGQDGMFYLLDAATGNTLWSYNTDAPIMQTVAYANGIAFVTNMAMNIIALDIPTQQLIWKSQSLDALAFKDYWPFVYGNRVWVRAMMIGTSFFAFNVSTGSPFTIPYQFDGQTMNGATAPPCVDRDSHFAVPATRSDSEWISGWGAMDPDNGTLIDRFTDVANLNAGYGNRDENMAVTCTQNLVLAFHIEEYNANYTGFYNLDTRTWTQIGRGWKNGQMSTNTQGGGANQATIAGGRIFHISYHELVVRTTQ